MRNVPYEVVEVYGKKELLAAIGAIEPFAPVKIVLVRKDGRTIFTFDYRNISWRYQLTPGKGNKWFCDNIWNRVLQMQRHIRKLPAKAFE
jgi:hypothetical protein